MPSTPTVEDSVVAAWQTSSRVTTHLVENMPPELWSVRLPGIPTRTFRAVAAHLHNSRCRWLKTLGREHGISAPTRVDHRRVTRRQLVPALERSRRGIAALLELGCR